jgi:hypothetical protein
MPRIAVGIRIKPQQTELLKGFSYNNGVDGSKVELTAANTRNEFTYDNVFDSTCTQEHIFSTCGTPIISSVIDGFNGTLFAYGQTGAGRLRRRFLCNLNPYIF